MRHYQPARKMSGKLVENQIVGLAREIADAAPKRRSTYVTNAGIPWRLIEELRGLIADVDALEAS